MSMKRYKNYFYGYNYVKTVKGLSGVLNLSSHFNDFISINKEKFKNITINKNEQIYITRNIDGEDFYFYLELTNMNLGDALILGIYISSECLDCWEEDFDLKETPLLKIKKEDIEGEIEDDLFREIRFFLPYTYTMNIYMNKDGFEEWKENGKYDNNIKELEEKENKLLAIINTRKSNQEWQLLNNKKVLRNTIYNKKIKDNYENLFKEELEIIKYEFEKYLNTLDIECGFSEIGYTEIIDLK